MIFHISTGCNLTVLFPWKPSSFFFLILKWLKGKKTFLTDPDQFCISQNVIEMSSSFVVLQSCI